MAIGDTLQSIAQGAYGDSKLWYLIADANGLRDNNDLKVGQTLIIPNRVTSTYNSSNSFKPYNAAGIIGDTTPNMPVRPADEGCGVIGQIIVIVIAVVATVFTAGLLAAPAGTLASGGIGAIFSAGATAMLGGSVAAAGIMGAATVSGISAATALGAAIVGGAVGSIVSQGAAMAMGMQNEFSWKQVGLGALGAGIGASGFAGAVSSWAGGGIPGAMSAAAASNVVTQGIAVATGLQQQFSWRGVAASAVGAGVGSMLSSAMNGNPLANDPSARTALFSELGVTGNILRSTITGFTTSITRQIVMGGKIQYANIAADAFGNALGNGVVEQNSGIKSNNSTQTKTLDDDFEEEKVGDKTDPTFKRKLSTLGSLWSRAKNTQDILEKFKVDDTYFNNVVTDIREKGYDSEYAPVLGFALKTDDKDFLARVVASQRDKAYNAGMSRATLLEAVATHGLADLGFTDVTVVDHPKFGNFTKETLDFFSDPTAAKGITRNAWLGMYETGITDFRTFEQVGYAAFERKAGQAEALAGLAWLGADVLMDPKKYLNLVRGVGSELSAIATLSMQRLGRVQSFLFGKIDTLYSGLTRPGLNSSLVRVESQIVKQSFETGIVVDDVGRILVRRDAKIGQDLAITLTQEERNLVSGNTFTHNHPNGFPFSIADVKSSLAYEAKSIRAVTDDLTYVMEIDRSAAGFPLEQIQGNATSFMTKQYAKAEQITMNQFGVGILKTSAEVGTKEFQIWFKNEVWHNFAKNTPGISYKVLPTR